MARARIISNRGGGRQQYSFSNPQQGLDLQGARSLEGDYQDALRQEQHAASQQYQQMHAELELAKLKRELAHDEAKVQRRIKYETMMEKAIPELYSIDPADPQAVQKRASFAARWPQLFHKENDVPGITSEFEQHTRLSSEADRQRNEIAAKKEAADLRAADKAEAAKTAAEERRQRDKEHQDFMRELHPPKVGPSDAIRERYLKSSKNADDLNKRLELNKGFIDELEARDVTGSKSPLKAEEETRLVALKKSRETIQNDYNREMGRKEALEMVHPELSPDYVAKPKTDTPGGDGDASGSTKASATPLSPAAIDTAQPDVPEIEKTAPVARGTATPSGEMDTSGSTNGTAPMPPVPTAALPAEGEDTVPDLSGAPAAVAPATVPPVTPAALVPATPAPHPADPEWDSITQQMESARGNADAARARRQSAMDIIAKAKPTDYLNPFDKTFENAQKEVEAASALADQHDTTYKQLFDKRGALLQKTAPSAPVASAVTPAPATPMPPPAAAAATDEPHPYEGMRVKQKSTGRYGTFKNGQFVTEEDEQGLDQPTE